MQGLQLCFIILLLKIIFYIIFPHYSIICSYQKAIIQQSSLLHYPIIFKTSCSLLSKEVLEVNCRMFFFVSQGFKCYNS
jgi:hypothetical protein